MAKRPPIPGEIDIGIKKAVEILKASGIENSSHVKEAPVTL